MSIKFGRKSKIIIPKEKKEKSKKIKNKKVNKKRNIHKNKIMKNIFDLKNYKIKFKLILGFSVVFFFFIVTILVSLFNLNGVSKNMDKFYNNIYATSTACTSARSSVINIENNMLKLIAESETITDVEVYLTEIQESLDSFYKAITLLNENYSSSEKELNAIQSHIDDSVKYKEEIFEFVRNGGFIGAKKVLNFNYLPALRKALSYMTPIEKKLENDVNNAISEANRMYISALIIIISTFAIGVIVAVILCVAITRNIMKPMREIENAASNMASGQLNTQITYESKDELGKLADSLKTTTTALSSYIISISDTLDCIAKGDMNVDIDIDYIGDFAPIKDSMLTIASSLSASLYQINQSSDQVASGAEQVASGSQALSQGAVQQASAIDSLSTSINNISNKVKNNTVNAENASKFSIGVLQAVERGNNLMKQLVDAMNDISINSKEIGNIIKTIDDIAFQTNVLALNASVEAARAGDAGRGFAVVAGEVGVLANKSAESVEETSELIENALKSIKKGMKLVNETARALDEIVKGAKVSTDYVNQIVEASNEQLSAIEDVIIGVEQISSVVQTNSATAEQSAAASEELSSLANTLKKEVDKFKLANEIASLY